MPNYGVGRNEERAKQEQSRFPFAAAKSPAIPAKSGRLGRIYTLRPFR